MKKLLPGLFFLLHCSLLPAQQTVVQYLSGTDKDHTVSWDFFCTKGRRSGSWTTIRVPSCWEQQGFGSYAYYKDVDDPEQGLYRHAFRVAPAHKGKRVFIVFDGVMTDTEVKINGQSAGELHQGGFYQFKYDITSLLKWDAANLLEVKVSRHSANASINRAERKADFWLFGGIFRPVFLEIAPPVFTERVAIDARADGDFNMQVFSNAAGNQTVEAQVVTLDGRPVDQPFRLQPGDSMLHHRFTGIQLWNPEQPRLYQVSVSIKEGNKVLHTLRQRFGFRTVEMRAHDGFYVNGVKVIFKGVCRHSEWPETGRTLSRAVHLLDIGAIKDMNMNAVRMSHYPPDRAFLDLCDSLGLFVLDELTGWQAAYDTVVGRKLVKELVIRDVNHPSIVIWDNGNEGGWNRALDNDYQLYDPQKRWVIHPWEKFNGTNTKHYPDFKYVQNEVATGTDIFFPTEFMHGLFDGGHGAALDDFWNEMMRSPRSAGAFLWSLHDEGVVRTDRHDSIDVAGNQAPDGIVGPHREKEGSYYTVKEIWSPVYMEAETLPANFDGKLPLTNKYLYTNLHECRFEWKLVQFAGTGKAAAVREISKGVAPAFSLAPGQSGVLDLKLGNPGNADALYLTGYDRDKRKIYTWSWPMHSAEQMAGRFAAAGSGGLTTKDENTSFTVTCDGVIYSFDKSNGYLQQIVTGKKTISLSNGPAPAGSTLTLTAFRHEQQGSTYVVEPVYREDDHFSAKWIFQSGKLPRLSYQYRIAEDRHYAGITFNYPEEKITGLKWLGRGPYHVWKNRLKGTQLGIWQKKYNNTITGESWNYPEFKGWHAGVYWATVQSREADFTIITKDADNYFQMLRPAKPVGAANNNTSPDFPGNTIGFFQTISAIGTKFQPAAVMGPQSGANGVTGDVKGTLLFLLEP